MSTPAGTMPSLSASLTPSARAAAGRTGRPGWGRTASACGPGSCARQDRHQHREQQEDEDGEGFGDHQPPRVVAEAADRGTSLLCPPVDTTPPAVTPSCSVTAEPAEFSGSHTTRSGISVIISGRVIAPRSVLTVTGSPRRRRFRRRSPQTAAPPAGARCPPDSVRRPAAARRRAASASRPAPPAGTGRRRPVRRHRGASGRCPSHARAGRFRRRRPAVRQAEVDADLVGQVLQHPQIRDRVGLQRGSNGRFRPSQLRNVPDFSATGATGKTTSARSVTALCRSSRLTTNGAASTAASAASGSGRSAISTPPTSSAPRPAAGAARIAAVSRPGGGQFGDVPCGGDCSRARVAHGTAAGQQAGQCAGLQRAAFAGAARDPGQPGPGRAASRRRRQRAGEPASRSPTMMTRAGKLQLRRRRRGRRARWPRRRARTGSACPPSSSARGSRTAPPSHRQRACGRPCAAAGRRSATPLRVRSRPAAPPGALPGRRR